MASSRPRGVRRGTRSPDLPFESNRRAAGGFLLPADAVTQLHEICAHLVHRRQVIETWGFGDKLVTGRGTNVLFAGPSGTGGTRLAAEIIAHELELDLYRIDLASVVSELHWGNREELGEDFHRCGNRQRDPVLRRSRRLAAAGDPRCGTRTIGYANLEISYLLQRMEQRHGLAILATNLRQNLDEAFTRRLAFIVRISVPRRDSPLSDMDRRLPASIPLAPDVDWLRSRSS